MTYTDVNTTPLAVENTGDGYDITHIYCCLDENLGLCGADLVGAGKQATPIECVPCAIAEQKGTCPKMFMCHNDKYHFTDS